MEGTFKPLNEFTKEQLAKFERRAGKRSWWIRIPKKWWLNDLEGLGPSERCVLISLRLHADREGKCFPSLRTLARQLSVNPKTILRAVKKLETKGYVKIVVRRGRFNSYILNGHSC